MVMLEALKPAVIPGEVEESRFGNAAASFDFASLRMTTLCFNVSTI
jgi:hypothetical protein